MGILLERCANMSSNTSAKQSVKRSFVPCDFIELIKEIRRDRNSNRCLSAPQAAIAIREHLDVRYKQEFPIVEILSAIGIKTFQKELVPNELSSYIYISPKCKELYEVSTIVCVNVLESLNNKRFALAYEFGRYLYDYNGIDAEYYDEYYSKLLNHKNDEITNYICSFANSLLSVEL